MSRKRRWGLFLGEGRTAVKGKSVLILGTLVSFAVLLLACDSRKQEKTSQRWDEKLQAFRAIWADRYDPVLFPPKSFAHRRIFTENLRSLLISQAGRPVMFDGFLEDITEQGDQFYVRFISRLSHVAADERSVRFHLSCEYEDVQTFLEKPPEYDLMSRYLFLRGIRKDFLVIARVTDVKKIEHYRVIGRSSEGSDKVDLEIQAPDIFSVQGELVNMVKYSEIAR
jgi:hypothetical protein